MARVRMRPWMMVALGAAAPLAVASALVPLRAHIDNANVALLLAAVVVAIAATGYRPAAVLAAVSGANWFDFFHTKPYQSFTFASGDDLITAIVLLVVGLAVGEIAIRARRHRQAAMEGSHEIARIHDVAELVAGGEPADLVVIAVAGELRELLALQDCRFERGDRFLDEKPMAHLQRNGDVTMGEVRWGVHHLGVPSDRVALGVYGGGRMFGRYVLARTIAVPISFDRRVVAVALADQVGAAFAAAPVGPTDA